MAARAPAGWPHDLPPPGTEEFEAAVASWLLDRGPADLRTSPLRHQPIALAWAVSHHVDATLTGVRAAYASARTGLGEYLSADQVATVQTALEAEGARALQAQRETSLVSDALRAAARSTKTRTP